MRKCFVGLAAIAVTMMLVPTLASAKDRESYADKKGRFGIGFDSSLAGVSGLSARFQVAKNFGLQGIAAFSRSSLDLDNGADDGMTLSSIRFAMRGDVTIAYTRQATLGVLFGVNMYNDSFDVAGADSQSETNFAFESGLKAEYHFSNFFSVHGETGVVFALLDKASDTLVLAGADTPVGFVDGDADGSLLNFGLGDTFGSFGFTFWFK